jgi:methyltransferase (TIGR00027 family)
MLAHFHNGTPTMDRQPSSTAIGAALLRAVHLLLDAPPPILADDQAMRLAGIPDADALKAALQKLHAEFSHRADPALADELLRSLRASIVLRNRYAEDELERACARGVRQYVLLGAGLDSFAQRRPAWAEALEIFELDLPATQAWKRQRLQDLGLALPARLHLIPADLLHQPPLEALAGSAFRHDQPAFFSWLGVTSYLSEDAVYATLGNLAKAAPGSAVVFNYGLGETNIDEAGRRINAALKAGIAARNEPAANSGFRPEALAGRLRELGYAEVTDLDFDAAERRYFAGRSDGLHAPTTTRLMLARV